MEIPDRITDWPLCLTADYDGEPRAECEFTWFTEHPDKRTKTGMRTRQHWCSQTLGRPWNIRELADSIAAHITEAHPE